MTLRIRILVSVIVVVGVGSLSSVIGYPSHHWIYFFVYLAAVLLSSGMKVGIPKSEGTMSVNFPFILLGILQLSPLQAVGLAVCSVFAQCRIRVVKPFTAVQIAFNLANVITATVAAWQVHLALRNLHVPIAPALTAAALVYFLANTVPVALVIAWDSNASPYRQWRRDFFWYFPFYLVGALLVATANQICLSSDWLTSLLLIPFAYIIYRVYSEQLAIIRDRERHIQETEALNLRTIEALAMAIEAKDQSTHRHLVRVRVYVKEIGRIMGLDESTMRALTTASYLHDIGKLAVPEHIINKPGKLTHEEFEKMKIHPAVGADMLERVRFPYPVVPIVRSHHEAWDGSGYPDGLRGEEIPIGARILTAVDCFDALASERPYRKALPVADAMAFVRSKAGIQFDPQVVRVLDEHFLTLEQKATQEKEEMAPLKTDLLVARGAAPGAGFEPEQRSPASVEGGTGSPAPVSEAKRPTENDSLYLIAAAALEAKAVFELSRALGNSLSSRETTAMISDCLSPVIPFDCLAVYLKSDDFLQPHYIDGNCARAFSWQSLPIGEGLSGWVARNERPILNGNPTVESNYVTVSGSYSAESSALSIPLFELSGAVFGALTVYSCEHGAFSKDHLRILQAIEPKFSLSLQNALRFQVAETDAKLDHLTQLPNMRHFLAEVDAEFERGRAGGYSFAIAVCDLNSFKAFNDRHGHMVGNELLWRIAEAFRQCRRIEDTVARMGSDEFVFLFRAVKPKSAQPNLTKIEEAVANACAELNLDTTVSTSIGVAFFPDDGDSKESLLGAADRRMYARKQTFDGSPRQAAALPNLEQLSAV